MMASKKAKPPDKKKSRAIAREDLQSQEMLLCSLSKRKVRHFPVYNQIIFDF